MTESTIVFAGDSVTDCGRREDPRRLGDGYVRLLADAHPGARILNRGVSGDRVRDLRARWPRDVLDERPALVSILIGVNDTWRRYDSDDPTAVEAFESDYRAIVEPLAASGTRLVFVEPFLLPVNEYQSRWREDLDPKIDAVHRLAAEFGGTLVAADAGLRARGSAADLAPDGVHPNIAGHLELARLWDKSAGGMLADLV
ncbi:SGNH/GDSL hydrolase family protein [Nonomuraea aridisoli]|uniref:GDSL family lipase n=1 Tax=Nonomuraea aridisoli TaxID=2070368 RepID=A0A2W2ENI1_9ACTN|nr:SGNH/GDSL hydrolase family protein [Nonomuraea aridisoli]PZG18165.1 GDSL family lipase [Nonomuraea aridisoli]